MSQDDRPSGNVSSGEANRRRTCYAPPVDVSTSRQLSTISSQQAMQQNVIMLHTDSKALMLLQPNLLWNQQMTWANGRMVKRSDHGKRGIGIKGLGGVDRWSSGQTTRPGPGSLPRPARPRRSAQPTASPVLTRVWVPLRDSGPPTSEDARVLSGTAGGEHPGG